MFQFFDLLVLEAIYFYFFVAVFSLLMMRRRSFNIWCTRKDQLWSAKDVPRPSLVASDIYFQGCSLPQVLFTKRQCLGLRAPRGIQGVCIGLV